MAKHPIKLMKFKKMLLERPDLTPTDIAFETYDCKNRHVASVIAGQNLIKLDFGMKELMEREGLTDEDDLDILKGCRRAMKNISCNIYIKPADGEAVEMKSADGVSKDFIEVEDYPTRLKAIELTWKFKGYLRRFDAAAQENGTKTDEILIQLIRKADKELQDVKGIRFVRRETTNLDKHLSK